MQAEFVQQNHDWNADPNAPEPSVIEDGSDILLKFELNSYIFPQFQMFDLGILRFINCTRFRIGAVNGDGWYMGQCRFSDLAPSWGEFFMVRANKNLLDEPNDWILRGAEKQDLNHYLFYFRDETFECSSENWAFENSDSNSLLKLSD